MHTFGKLPDSIISMILSFLTKDFGVVETLLNFLSPQAFCSLDVSNYMFTARQWYKWRHVLPSSPKKLFYEFMPEDHLQSMLDSLPALEELEFGDLFDECLDDITFPSNLTSIVFNVVFNQPIDKINWPSSLQRIRFGKFFNQPIDNINWPSSLKELHFSRQFEQSTHQVKWPEKLETLNLNNYAFIKYFYNEEPTNGVSFTPLPASLTDLHQPIHLWRHYSTQEVLFPTDSNYICRDSLPNSLLRMSMFFSDEYPSLPASLTWLQLKVSSLEMSHEGYQDFQSLTSLKFLEFLNPCVLSSEYKQINILHLPPNLEQLVFTNVINISFDVLKLPSSLKRIVFTHDHLSSLINSTLPALESLENVCFLSYMYEEEEKYQEFIFPSSLTYLSFSSNCSAKCLKFVQLPTSLKTLQFGTFDDAHWCLSNLRLCQTQLTKLRFLSGNFRFRLPALPCTLEELVFENVVWNVSQPFVECVLPVGLKVFKMGRICDQPLDNVVLPASLETLHLSDDFNYPIDKVKFPVNLKSLYFGTSFNQSVTGVMFPDSITDLDFGDDFNRGVESCMLPSSLHRLKLGFNFNKDLAHVRLPWTLHTLILGEAFSQDLTCVLNSKDVSVQHLQVGKSYQPEIFSPHLKVLRYGDKSIKTLLEVLLPKVIEVDGFTLSSAIKRKRKLVL